jgi:hypothetical protein
MFSNRALYALHVSVYVYVYVCLYICMYIYPCIHLSMYVFLINMYVFLINNPYLCSGPANSLIEISVMKLQTVKKLCLINCCDVYGKNLMEHVLAPPSLLDAQADRDRVKYLYIHTYTHTYIHT